MASIRASTAAAASVGVLRRHVGLAEGRCQGKTPVSWTKRGGCRRRSRPPRCHQAKGCRAGLLRREGQGVKQDAAILARFQLRAVRQGQGPRMLPAAGGRPPSGSLRPGPSAAQLCRVVGQAVADRPGCLGACQINPGNDFGVLCIVIRSSSTVISAVGSASAKTEVGVDPNTLGKRSAELLRYAAICQLLRGIRCAVLNNICLLVAAKDNKYSCLPPREEAIAEHRPTVYQDCDTALFSLH